MPSDHRSTIWDADPHTRAKIDILRGYLTAWFPILGCSMHGKDLIYIDGFAGPGEYTNYPTGSPIVAIEAALAARAANYDQWVAATIHCAFIEVDQGRYANLVQRIERYRGRPKLRLHPMRDTFVAGMARLERTVPSLMSGHPLFVFIDPFGATSVPFSIVARILSNPTAEVLINLDADGIARVMRAAATAPTAATARTVDEIFGTDSWRSLRARQLGFHGESRAVLDLYQSQLRALPDVRYTFPFEMQSQNGTLNYFLVFASQHPLGLVRMKEAMSRIDTSGAYCFSDAHSQEARLFRFDHPEDYARQLVAQFEGQTVPYTAVRDYTLTDTPFTTPKSMLKLLEDQDRIDVRGTEGYRRRGTFPDEQADTMQIYFRPTPPQPLSLFPDLP